MKEEYEITMLDTIEYRFKVDKETKDKFNYFMQNGYRNTAFEHVNLVSPAEEGGITHCDYRLSEIRDLTA